MRCLLILVIAFSCILYHNAAATSFDCGSARTHVEHLICSSNTLSDLDNQLAGEFYGASSWTPDQLGLNSSQRKWLNERNSCLDEACLLQEYRSRLEKLPTIKGAALESAKREVAEANALASKVCSEVGLAPKQLFSPELFTLDNYGPYIKEKAIQAAKTDEADCRQLSQELRKSEEGQQADGSADAKLQQAKSPSKPIDGWSDFKFGMTLGEASDLQNSSPALQNVLIEETPFSVSLGFSYDSPPPDIDYLQPGGMRKLHDYDREHQKLDKIQLFIGRDGRPPFCAATRILEALTLKYGEPYERHIVKSVSAYGPDTSPGGEVTWGNIKRYVHLSWLDSNCNIVITYADATIKYVPAPYTPPKGPL